MSSKAPKHRWEGIDVEEEGIVLYLLPSQAQWLLDHMVDVGHDRLPELLAEAIAIWHEDYGTSAL